MDEARQFENLDFPIVGSKIKVVVVPNTIRKYHIRSKWYFCGIFGWYLGLFSY